jgi:hypothetical protein
MWFEGVRARRYKGTQAGLPRLLVRGVGCSLGAWASRGGGELDKAAIARRSPKASAEALAETDAVRTQMCEVAFWLRSQEWLLHARLGGLAAGAGEPGGFNARQGGAEGGAIYAGLPAGAELTGVEAVAARLVDGHSVRSPGTVLRRGGSLRIRVGSR